MNISANVAFMVMVSLPPFMRRSTMSLVVLLVVDWSDPDHIWIVATPFSSVALVSYIQRRAALLPWGSWFTAMTAGLEIIARSAGLIVRRSLPRMRGLFAIDPF